MLDDLDKGLEYSKTYKSLVKTFTNTPLGFFENSAAISLLEASVINMVAKKCAASEIKIMRKKDVRTPPLVEW